MTIPRPADTNKEIIAREIIWCSLLSIPVDYGGVEGVESGRRR